MDPVSLGALISKLYQIGGLVLVQTIIMAGFFWYFRLDSLKREERMAKALEGCQKDRADFNVAATSALMEHSQSVKENTSATQALTGVMRDRPCLKDPTPIHGHQFSTPRPS
jgi:hypothetical protein